MTMAINKIKSIFNKSLESDNVSYSFYKKILSQISREIEKEPELINEEMVLAKLGFLYDHLAVYAGNKKEKNKYEREALKAYNKILKKNPNSVNAIWGIGRVYWHNKNKKAIDYAKKAARIATKESVEMYPMYMNVAVVYESLSQFDRAEYWYLKVIKKRPKFLGAYLNLAEMYLEKNKNKKYKKLILEIEKQFSEEELDDSKFKKIKKRGEV
jgi:tetratricopeptide (TPR) repeat protein